MNESTDFKLFKEIIRKLKKQICIVLLVEGGTKPQLEPDALSDIYYANLKKKVWAKTCYQKSIVLVLVPKL